MSEQDFNTVFSNRLRYYLKKYEITQLELSKRLGVGTTSVYNWCNGIKTPRMDKVDKMCELFHCKRSDLMEDRSDQESERGWYTNPETAQIAQEIYDNKELSLLFDAAKDAEPEDLKMVHDMLLRMKRAERGE